MASVYNNPYFQQLQQSPMQQQPQLQGILNPVGLQNFGAALLVANNQPNANTWEAIGKSLLSAQQNVDQYNSNINQNAYKNAMYNLNLANAASTADYRDRALASETDYRNKSLGLDDKRFNLEEKRLGILQQEEDRKAKAANDYNNLIFGKFGGQPITYEDTNARMTMMSEPAQPSGILDNNLKPKNAAEALLAKTNPSEYLKTKIAAPNNMFEQETILRKEYDALSKDYKGIADAYSKIQSVSETPTAAGDISLIYGFMKLNDPSSTVREGEFATAQNAGGIPDRIRAQYNSVVNGQRLSENQRADFLNQATNIYQAQKQNQDQITSAFTERAKQYGLNPKNIVSEFKSNTFNKINATTLKEDPLGLYK